MTDICEELANCFMYTEDELIKTTTKAANEIETLRQRVKDLEASTGSKRVIELQERVYLLEDKIAALKAGQGEPVGYVSAESITYLSDGEGTESTIYQAPFDNNTVAVHTSAPITPEGWQLVPVEPTFEMEVAWNTQKYWLAAYPAMLAAAPKPKETK